MDIQPLYISGDRVERVPDFHFLGSHGELGLRCEHGRAGKEDPAETLFPERHQEK